MTWNLALARMAALGLLFSFTFCACKKDAPAAEPAPLPAAQVTTQPTALRAPSTSETALGVAPTAGSSPTLAWQLPPDSPALPAGTTPSAFQPAIDDYAWQMFVAMSWPASATERGIADPAQQIGAPGMTVWGSLKDVDEVFLPDAASPAAWDAWPSSEPAACQASDKPMKHLTMQSKVSPQMRNVAQAVGGTLTDQRGNLARYAESMNQYEFGAIVAQHLFNADVQAAQKTDLSLPFGSMEVKSAWREWTDAEDKATWTDANGNQPPLAARYYIQPFCVLDKDGQTWATKKMALVGLHISRKTPNAPEWIWTTFEQVDNVNAGAPFCSFFNILCGSCPPNTSTEVNGKPTTKPTQVTRLTSIDPARLKRNAVWQKALAAVPGSPWPYYELIGAQWPTEPKQSALSGVPFPAQVANVVIETYNQATSSCMNCHTGARLAGVGVNVPRYSDYSYLLGHATTPRRRPQSRPSNRPRNAQ